MITLRPYQSEGANEIRGEFLKGIRAVCYVLATGGGKTVVFSYVATEAFKKAKRVLILMHRIELIRQTSAALTKNDVPHGIINPRFTPAPYKYVQVASVQTLVKRIGKMSFDYDLIIIDECHHSLASTYRKIIEQCTKAYILGVTATPCRSDGSGLGEMFQSMVIGPDTPTLIDIGALVRPRVFGPRQLVDMSDIDIVRGDYDKKKSASKIDKPTITGDAVTEYTKLCAGAPCVVFCISVDHAVHVAEQFRESGYRAESVDGEMDDETRQDRLDGLGTGKWQVITTCDLISEGTDIPAITCAILLRPTASEGLYIQQVGRALRLSEGKTEAIILDHVGNYLRHGFPDDPRNWSLEGSKKRSRKKLNDDENESKLSIRQCPKCAYVHIPAVVCPECGHVYVTAKSGPNMIDGELKELTREDKDNLKKMLRVKIAESRTLNDLLLIEKESGYKRGWAKHVWAARGRKIHNV